MRGRGTTLGELRWPRTPEFLSAATRLQASALGIILNAVWTGYDSFVLEVLSGVDLTQADAEVERSITQSLVPFIQRVIDPRAPFYVQHAFRENETRLAPPAQAPEYDMAFVLWANMRIAWPLEAKVLRTDRAIGAYIRDIKEQFLTCRYAPFSRSGGMVGYLIRGSALVAFAEIENALHLRLVLEPLVPSRDHRRSNHTRIGPTGKPYPRQFTCHHFMLSMF